jgi:hypothetical protein
MTDAQVAKGARAAWVFGDFQWSQLIKTLRKWVGNLWPKTTHRVSQNSTVLLGVGTFMQDFT